MFGILQFFQTIVVAVTMNCNNTAYLHVGQVVDRGIHLENRKTAQAVERTIFRGLPKRTFEGQALDSDPSVQCCKLHGDHRLCKKYLARYPDDDKASFPRFPGKS